jgi:hypothetical protein
MKLFHAIANYMSGFFTNDLEPWLKNLGNVVSHDVVTKLMPYAHVAVNELLTAGADLLAGGDPHMILTNTIIAAENTGKAAIADSIQAAGHDLLTAVAAAIATAEAAKPAVQ